MFGVVGAVSVVIVAAVIGLVFVRRPVPTRTEVADNAAGKMASSGASDIRFPSTTASAETKGIGQTRSASPPKTRANVAKETAGRKLAFLVGITKYNHQDLKDLEFPERDVADLGTVLEGDGFQVVSLTAEGGQQDSALKPVADNIRRQLKELLRGATKHDLVLVGLAGHGLQPLGSDESYFCAMDSNPTIKEGKLLEPATLVGIGEVLALLRDSGIGDKLLLVDACRNDPSVRGNSGVDRVNIALPAQTGVLMGCSPGEFSFESKSFGGGHGAFFFHVVEGLKGAAADEDGDITWDSLQSYVRKRVPFAVQQVFGKLGGDQKPNAIGNLRGEPTVLAIAPAGSRPEPKPQDAPPIPTPSRLTPQMADKFAGKAAGETRMDNSLSTTLVWIPAGQFVMGSPASEEGRDENEDQKPVTIPSGFWLGQHEVTRAEWRRVMQKELWKLKLENSDECPATNMTWDDAMEFCEKLTDRDRAASLLSSGWRYTLPTETEWEYACRATAATAYSFGDDTSKLDEYAWYAAKPHDPRDGINTVHPVAQKKPNSWGLFDMAGNAWEWCRDPRTNQTAAESSARMMRGGSFATPARYCRSANRSGGPAAHGPALGFRLAAVPAGD
jgi:formylglycine-generating enzyme required for sulfatase activity